MDINNHRYLGDRPRQHRVAWSEYIRQGLAFFVVLLVLVFLLTKVIAIFQPPPLTIVYPQDGKITTDRQMQVTGLSSPEAEIVINNSAVLIDPAGKFSTTIDLQKGLNLIKITAKKRYSRSSEAEIRILFNE